MVNTYEVGVGWDDPQQVLNPGDGAFIIAPSAFSVTFSGNPAPSLTTRTQPRCCSLLSCQIFNSATLGSDFEGVAGFLPNASDCYRLEKHDPGFPIGQNGSPNFTVFTYECGVWSPASPTIEWGESVIICQLANCADTTPPTMILKPDIDVLSANGTTHEFKAKSLVQSVADNCDSNLKKKDVVITHVECDEPAPTIGGPDIVIAASCESVELRYRGSNRLDGRVYTIHLKVTDASNNTAYGSIKVKIFLSGLAITSPTVYTVLSPCY